MKTNSIQLHIKCVTVILVIHCRNWKMKKCCTVICMVVKCQEKLKVRENLFFKIPGKSGNLISSQEIVIS